MYYNTTNESGDLLKWYEQRNDTQEDKILRFFSENQGKRYTPFEVLDALGLQAPVTSIRRAITDLTAAGKLRKTETKRRGPYGKPSYTWEFV